MTTEFFTILAADYTGGKFYAVCAIGRNCTLELQGEFVTLSYGLTGQYCCCNTTIGILNFYVCYCAGICTCACTCAGTCACACTCTCACVSTPINYDVLAELDYDFRKALGCGSGNSRCYAYQCKRFYYRNNKRTIGRAYCRVVAKACQKTLGDVDCVFTRYSDGVNQRQCHYAIYYHERTFVSLFANIDICLVCLVVVAINHVVEFHCNLGQLGNYLYGLCNLYCKGCKRLFHCEPQCSTCIGQQCNIGTIGYTCDNACGDCKAVLATCCCSCGKSNCEHFLIYCE